MPNSNIKLSDNFSLSMVVPKYIQRDKNFQGIIYALESEMKRIFNHFDFLSLYINIDKLPERILDELAWQFNIVEYDLAYPIDIKRTLINGCMELHHKRGTVKAVEEVAEKIFGNAQVEEWFEYGGEPYTFRIRTSNVGSTDEMIKEVESIVKTTQNIRSHLEEVIIDIMETLHLYHGCVIEVETDRTILGLNQ